MDRRSTGGRSCSTPSRVWATRFSSSATRSSYASAGERYSSNARRSYSICSAPAAGVDQLLASGSALPPFDVHASLMSLPRILGTHLETIPATVPYIFADPGLIERRRRVLEPLSGLKVGIVWQGNPKYAGDRLRSILLESLRSTGESQGNPSHQPSKRAAGASSCRRSRSSIRSLISAAGSMTRWACS